MEQDLQAPAPDGAGGPDIARLTDTLDFATGRLETARPFAKARYQVPVFDVISRLLAQPDGFGVLFARAGRLDAAGLFAGSDWDVPEALLPQLVGAALGSDDRIAQAREAASLARFLAVATGEARHDNLHAEGARHFLTQVLALNLRDLFGATDEASRAAGAAHAVKVRVIAEVADKIGLDDVLGALVHEVWRLLEQRSVQVGVVKDMIAQISIALHRSGAAPGATRLGTERLVGALFGPTDASRDDPGLSAFLGRMAHTDVTGLEREAMAFARAMHDTGLVSDYHAAFVSWAIEERDAALIPEALGLGPTGRDCWRRFQPLIGALIRRAVTPYTPQAVYGLALLLDRGILHHEPMVPGLYRQLGLTLSDAARTRLSLACPGEVPPEAHLLAGVLQVLGQPLGVGQGANPTCQSARAIAMWALNDPDYLLHLVTQAAEFDTILMQFEDTPIASAGLPEGLGGAGPVDADPVSTLLVPHLDRIYAEMGRLCIGRPDDPHRWVNPQFHGWWVARDCAVAVDIATGQLADYDHFVRRFFAAYHPRFNGGRPVAHPQPAGIAVCDPTGRFVGWHAIAILRVAADQHGAMRVYFYNPNNDSGQDWGQGVAVSTGGHGERYGEGSLRFDQFLSRVYLFHDDPLPPRAAGSGVPDDAVQAVRTQAVASWASGRTGTG